MKMSRAAGARAASAVMAGGSLLRSLALVLLTATLVACASGPTVVKVASSHGDSTDRVLYALPRVMVVVTVPIKVTTFVPTEITPQIGSLQCNVAERLDPHDACYWRFRSKDPGGEGALLSCPGAKASTHHLFAGGPASAVSVPVPDPEHVYAVRLRASGFQKLIVNLTLSQGGSPSALEYRATSPVLEVLELTAGTLAELGVTRTNALSIATSQYADLTPAMGVAKPVSDMQRVVDALAKLEALRLDLLKSPGVTQAALDQIAARQSELRSLVEGSVRTVEDSLALVFSPPNLARGHAATLQRVATVDPTAIDAMLPCEPTHNDQWLLELAPQAGSLAFATANTGSATTEHDGFMYRVPLFTDARLQLKSCDAGPGRGCKDSYVKIPGSVVVPQWGPVRSLPRRIGWGSGALASTLDPATGALVKVGSEGDNAAALDSAKFLLGEVERRRAEPPAPDDQAVLERQVAICAARHQLGLPAEGDCATFRPGD